MWKTSWLSGASYNSNSQSPLPPWNSNPRLTSAKIIFIDCQCFSLCWLFLQTTEKSSKTGAITPIYFRSPFGFWFQSPTRTTAAGGHPPKQQVMGMNVRSRIWENSNFQHFLYYSYFWRRCLHCPNLSPHSGMTSRCFFQNEITCFKLGLRAVT